MPVSGHRPHFDRPPVVEVVCGAQFAALEQWRTPHYGQFWSHIQAEYSDSEDQPPLPRIRLEPTPPIELQRLVLPPLRRVFFIKPPGNFLIQLQENRFLHNWRKVKDDDEYPRYDAAYERFIRYWQEFRSFLSEVKIPQPKPDTCELTYINHIMAEGASFPKDVWEFLAFYERSPEATTAMDASRMMMQFFWPLPNETGNLTLDVKHGNRTGDQREVLLMELTARGGVKEGEAGMAAWFGVAHDAIVNTFEKLTTTHAHQLWGKR
jgi:uncharacterized protein (TIGR04255 family)